MKEEILKAFQEKSEKTNNPELKKSIEQKIEILKGNKSIVK